MNPLASELNVVIENINPHLLEMLSEMGKKLYFPKGILTQSAEAKQKAHRINATIGIAKQNNRVMALPSVTELVNKIEPDNFLPYASSFGVPELRDRWKSAILEKNPSIANKQISIPVVTGGITHAVSTFADLWIDPDDTVILPDMMWGNYSMTFVVRNRAKIIHYNTYTPDLTKMDIDSFESVVRQEAKKGKKIITLLNFPHNPTGYTVSVEEANRIASILISIAKQGTNVVVGCDDAYFGLFFEKETMKESLFSLLAGADEHLVAVKMDGATKEDYVWGLRTGFITYGVCSNKVGGSNENKEAALRELYFALEKKTAGCIRGCVSNVSNLSQAIVLKSMEDDRYLEYKQEKFDLLKARALKIKEVLKDPAYSEAWEVYPFNSGYFMCIRLKDVDAEKLRVHMLDSYGIGLISIGSKNIRVAFSCLEEDQVKLLFDMILQGINDLRLNQS
ncbi:MAG: aminotransferase class I/II-fold pyridoxal phosphate-dependent enzyme [Desulfamplus sp.]|nr:aminotransferase class I/II-fold pyridoxal phosphate-dependent enzyme [Desulfamplus sp.]MBF0242447.1 aminotransferase class I/II-fold pyridoxal phosphate-dependent enzyme [Desulfamplus sp.]MBF0388830.1 aminotransferase class I/II-fold pyridoxal phosphate-dependent enzyme [Desulfamplus sp.]